MAREAKDAQVNLRIRPSLKAAAEAAAADDQRSLTSLIEKLLTDHLRERGNIGGTDITAPERAEKSASSLLSHEGILARNKRR